MMDKSSSEIYAEYRAMLEKASEVAKPFEYRAKELFKRYEEVWQNEKIIQIKSKEWFLNVLNGPVKKDLIKSDLRTINDGYVDDYDGPNKSGLKRYCCAYCPFLGGGDPFGPPCCTFKPYYDRFDICALISAEILNGRIMDDLISAGVRIRD